MRLFKVIGNFSRRLDQKQLQPLLSSAFQTFVSSNSPKSRYVNCEGPKKIVDKDFPYFKKTLKNLKA